MSMKQQGLLLLPGAISRPFERIGSLLRAFSDGVCCVFLSVGPVLDHIFANLLLPRITGHCGEPEQGAAK